MRNTIIYHKSGITTAWVCQRAYPYATVLAAYGVDTIDFSNFDRDDRVILCDFSYPYADMGLLSERVGELVILGHHTTQGDDSCGAMLAWLYFWPDEPAPWFLRHTRSRDYDGDCPVINTAINAALVGLGQAEAFKYFDALCYQREIDLIEEGAK